MLAVLAQVTTRVRVGGMAKGMHHRHPAVTANMVATLDRDSGGRLELGIGAGWNFMLCDGYGIDLGPLRDRSDRLEEGMEAIVRLLPETATTYTGRFFDMADAWCEPKSAQERIPIVIGGQGRVQTLRTAAKYADQWDMTFPADVAAWRELNEVLRARRA
ncbi:LLM class flavin-dependent oxidoreductase [Candidatus Poriferisodalis sp.]|uniref:LLM class flavin-dependent oxidoreductase n=1 Tax=Candidatus Poriferisodalis sp. TaxID=3101277 RepID=UPI003B018CB3